MMYVRCIAALLAVIQVVRVTSYETRFNYQPSISSYPDPRSFHTRGRTRDSRPRSPRTNDVDFYSNSGNAYSQRATGATDASRSYNTHRTPTYRAPRTPTYQRTPSYQAPRTPSYQAPRTPSYRAPRTPSYSAPRSRRPSSSSTYNSGHPVKFSNTRQSSGNTAQRAFTTYPTRRTLTKYPTRRAPTTYPTRRAPTTYPTRRAPTTYPTRRAPNTYPTHVSRNTASRPSSKSSASSSFNGYGAKFSSRRQPNNYNAYPSANGYLKNRVARQPQHVKSDYISSRPGSHDEYRNNRFGGIQLPVEKLDNQHSRANRFGNTLPVRGAKSRNFDSNRFPSGKPKKFDSTPLNGKASNNADRTALNEFLKGPKAAHQRSAGSALRPQQYGFLTTGLLVISVLALL